MATHGTERVQGEGLVPNSSVRTRERPLVPPNAVDLLIFEDASTVVEHARCRRLYGETLEAGPRVVLVRSRGESPILFALRVIHRVAAIEAHGEVLFRAVVIATSAAEHGLAAARSLVAQSLLSHLLRMGDGSLVFDTEAAADAAHDGAVFALARALFVKARATPVSVHLKHGADEILLERTTALTLAASGA